MSLGRRQSTLMLPPVLESRVRSLGAVGAVGVDVAPEATDEYEEKMPSGEDEATRMLYLVEWMRSACSHSRRGPKYTSASDA